MTVLDCDLVGFTGKAETMTPEDVAAGLSLFRSLVEEAVFEQDGAVLAHVGDGTVCLFGLRDDSDKSPEKAIACALTLLRHWNERARSLFSDEPPPLAIGIDFGLAAIGLVGEDRSLSLLATGAPVDGAASLQQATRFWKTCLLISERAWARLDSTPEMAVFEPCKQSGVGVLRLVAWD
ncbi:MAG: adenylate/guanylate cyclase domain-containing protein [Rhizomicrobium sp.]|nr:adenylate/guanylate cyclase domain-containing protein [Rhizomicrobium sp.]